MKKRLWPLTAALFTLTLIAAACGGTAEVTASDANGEEVEAQIAEEETHVHDGDEDHSHEGEEGHSHDGEEGHEHGDTVAVPEGVAVPQISISAEPDTISGHNLFIDLTDFNLAPENASTDPVDGEGHLHLYVNGERTLRFYNTALQLTDLGEGEHDIMVEVSANNHAAYAVDGEPIRAMTTITVGESDGEGHSHDEDGDTHSHDDEGAVVEAATAPTLDISITEDPASGWNLFADVENLTFSPENVGGEAIDGEGHLHLSIDGERVTRLYGPWWHISGLSAGDHEVMVEVSANDHSTYGVDGDPIIALTTLSVSEDQATTINDDGDNEVASQDVAVQDAEADDSHSHDDDAEGGHSHGGTGETLDLAATDADVVIEAVLVDGDLTVEDRRFSVETGQTVGVVFESDETEQVHLHGYDILADVGPDTSVDFAFLADSPGTFEVELEGSGRFLFEIQVS